MPNIIYSHAILQQFKLYDISELYSTPKVFFRIFLDKQIIDMIFVKCLRKRNLEVIVFLTPVNNDRDIFLQIIPN